MVRVPLLEQSELPDDYQYLLDEDAMGEINLLCAMANNPDVLQSYMRYGTSLWQDGGLDGDDLERCILGVARSLEATYEWNQHVPIARSLGVPEEDIHAISTGDFDHFDDRKAALLQYVQSVADGDVDNETHAELAEHVDDATIVGATQLATHYLATARFLDALDIPLEGSFVGWNLEAE
jgi:alkylhydroperoxidase family enzyme